MEKKIEVNIPNKVFYSLITIVALIIFGAGVYAYGTSNPAVLGHTISEITPPTNCNGYLKYTSTGWSCGTPSGTPITCTGTNKGLQWTGTSWYCATYSSSTTTTCGWTGWDETCASGYTEETWPQDISLNCYTIVKQYCSGGTITVKDKVSCCPLQLPS